MLSNLFMSTANILQQTEFQSPLMQAITLLKRLISLLTIIVQLAQILVEIVLFLLCPYTIKIYVPFIIHYERVMSIRWLTVKLPISIWWCTYVLRNAVLLRKKHGFKKVLLHGSWEITSFPSFLLFCTLTKFLFYRQSWAISSAI